MRWSRADWRDWRREDAERDRRARMTIDDADDAAKILAGVIAEIDQAAVKVEAGIYYGDVDAAMLARLRSCALTAIWRLPVGQYEWSAYPCSGDPPSPGARLLSHATTFQQAIRPWVREYWNQTEITRDPFVKATIRVPWSKRRVEGGPPYRYEFTPEQLAGRARRAARVAIRWGLVEGGDRARP